MLVALTGWGQPQDRRRTAEAGFDLHLVKPVAEAELFGALASSLPAERRVGGRLRGGLTRQARW